MERLKNLQRSDLKFPARVEVLSKERLSEPEVQNLITHNISSEEVSFKTEFPLPQGTRVKLQIFYSLAQSKRSPAGKFAIKAEGLVTRSNTEEMAVRFKRNFKIVPMSVAG